MTFEQLLDLNDQALEGRMSADREWKTAFDAMDWRAANRANIKARFFMRCWEAISWKLRDHLKPGVIA